MTARIWRAGDPPLTPGTRVRALVVEDAPAAVGEIGLVAGVDAHGLGAWVVFSRRIVGSLGAAESEWMVQELEVIEDGGEQ